MFDQNHITRARSRWINTNSTEIKCSVYELLVFIENYSEKRSESNWMVYGTMQPEEIWVSAATPMSTMTDRRGTIEFIEDGR